MSTQPSYWSQGLASIQCGSDRYREGDMKQAVTCYEYGIQLLIDHVRLMPHSSSKIEKQQEINTYLTFLENLTSIHKNQNQNVKQPSPTIATSPAMTQATTANFRCFVKRDGDNQVPLICVAKNIDVSKHSTPLQHIRDTIWQSFHHCDAFKDVSSANSIILRAILQEPQSEICLTSNEILIDWIPHLPQVAYGPFKGFISTTVTIRDTRKQDRDDEKEQYKGWSQEEKASDKQRIQKAKQAVEAKSFVGNNDNTNQNTSRSMGASDTSGWNTNFAFTSDQKKDDDTGNVDVAPSKQEEETNFARWNIGGGFSSVQGTEGFDNAAWGNNNNNGGFGSFGGSSLNLESLIISKPNKQCDKVVQRPMNATDDEENCKNITFQPIIELKEQSVDTGHEGEELYKSFNIKTLYVWGKDLSNQNIWKVRAQQTELQFYIDRSRRKARLTCRECKTSKLRLNHFILPKEHAKLNTKSDVVVGWSGFDDTIERKYDEDSYSTFCAKFLDAKSASEFRMCFEKCQ